MQVDFQEKYYGNSIESYLYVIGALVIVWIILVLIKRWVLKLIRKVANKTDNGYDNVIVSVIEKFLVPYLYLVINFTIIRQLALSERLDRILEVALTVITVIFAVRLINHAIHFSLLKYMDRTKEGPARMKQLTGVLIVVKVIMWSLGILFFLDNVGYDVTTVIAGLGVGGIAIALAAQNILGDLFSYFVIFFDKPFEIGDFIVVGEQKGTVERIGIKTSHVRSLGGEQMVMPNAELVKSTIYNFKRLEKRRAIFKVGVSYETSESHLEAIPGIIREAVLANEKTTVDRSHLSTFGDFSINFETVYFIDSPEYNVFMDINQSVALQVIKKFRELGIEIAYPTQKLYVEQNTTGDNKNSIESFLSNRPVNERNNLNDTEEK